MKDKDIRQTGGEETDSYYQRLFNSLPMGLMVQDYSAVKPYLDNLVVSGVSDIGSYLEKHPDELGHCINLVKIIDANDMAVRLFRASDKQSLTASLRRLFADQSVALFAQRLAALMRGESYATEIYGRLFNGETGHAQVRVHILPEYQATWERVQITITDITERKAAEEKLQASESKYQSLFEDSGEAAFMHRPSPEGLPGVFQEVNEAACELLGYSKAELLTLGPRDIVVWEKAGVTPPNITKRLETDKKVTMESTYRHKDGHEIPIEVSIHRFDLQGKPAVLTLARDITERKKAQDALLQAQAQLELMLGQIPCILWSMDKDLRYTTASGLGLQTSGRTPGDLVGKTIFEYSPKFTESSPFVIALRQALSGQSQVFEQTSVLNKRTFLVYMQPLFNTMSEIGGIVGVSVDITERKQAEEKLKRSSEELARQNVFIQAIIDNLPIGLAVNNIGDGKATYMNRSFEEIYGWPKEDIVDISSFFEKVYPDPAYRQTITSQIMADIASGDPGRMVWDGIETTTKSGETRIINAVNIPVVEQGIMVSTVRDITARVNAEKALRESEEKFRLLAENTEAIPWVYDVVLDQWAYVAPQVKRIIGYEPEEWTDIKFWTDRIYEEDREWAPLYCDECSKAGKPHTFEYRFIKKNGDLIWLRDVVSVEMRDGIPVKLRGFMLDITSQKQKEAELSQSRRQFEILFMDSPVSIMVHDKGTGEIVDANTKAWESYGLTSLEELITHDIFTKAPFSSAEALALIRKSAEEGHQEFEWFSRRADGTGFWEYVNLTTMVIGGVERVVASSIDITARRQAEQLAVDAVQEWRVTFDSITDMVAIVDADYKIARVNAAFTRVLNTRPHEVIGRHCYEVIHGRNTPHPSCPHSRTFENNKVEYSVYFDEKLNFWVESTSSPILGDQGQITGSVHIIKDISDRKRAEEEQHQLRDKAEMSSRLAAVGEMAAGIAHEINNPLTGVIGFSELLLTRPDVPEDMKQELTIINEGSQRVKGIVRRMLTFARQSKPEKSSVDINELIENTLELRGYVLKTSNIEVVRDFESRLPRVTADAGQLQQVFLNLIVNAEFAMKQAHDKGILVIKTERIDGHIRISITDDGPGMSAEVKAKLFQPFFTTKEPGEGTGMGLALSFGIIKEHGGSITVESVEGSGSTFIIELPVATAETAPSAVPVPVAPSPAPAKKGRVLVLDDEPTVGMLVKTILTGCGYEVTNCLVPAEALEKLRQGGYDLLILDIRMPGMSGIEFVEELRHRWPELLSRILFITGDTSDLTTREYLNTHQIPFITKPFEKKELEDKVNALL
ncbi:MAG: PAS domain S-box protein [Dehalogenimonas sp.]|uniref:histidine kinase n=1 Tax=Candidatus Dehalogenimonas loeffleri TaxID=3127115 RepID=A0ABZ2J4P5_9CHLR|nr:PAS domain S-box protein [Dehalogenimonas sp.]